MSRKTEESKFLAFVLRHNPGAIGASLDSEGWIGVEELLAKCKDHGRRLTRSMLDEIVASDSKKRYSYSEDGTKIRASQGHSVDVQLQYKQKEPPEFLFHGTIESSSVLILNEGIRKMQRTHVHLSSHIHTALMVGGRRGRPVVLKILAKRMCEAGHTFFISDNGVWLVDFVPKEFIAVLPREHYEEEAL